MPVSSKWVSLSLQRHTLNESETQKLCSDKRQNYVVHIHSNKRGILSGNKKKEQYLSWKQQNGHQELKTKLVWEISHAPTHILLLISPVSADVVEVVEYLQAGRGGLVKLMSTLSQYQRFLFCQYLAHHKRILGVTLTGLWVSVSGTLSIFQRGFLFCRSVPGIFLPQSPDELLNRVDDRLKVRWLVG